jgi:hypothetical protein
VNTGPPIARPPQDIRLSPAEAGVVSLSNPRYDLRARDGKLICTVTRESAERGIVQGCFQLWRGPAGAYLRSVGLTAPSDARPASVQQDSRKLLPGAPPKGAIQPKVGNRIHPTCGRVGCHRAYRVGPRYGVLI